MVDDLLTMTRAGQTVDSTEPVALADTARRAWGHTGAVGCELQLDVPESVTVDADRDRLLHVFENLFRNAVEHNESPVTVRVTLLDAGADSRAGARDSGFVVEDDGRGIPEGNREDIFEHGYTTRAEGTGFGLSIVRAIVEAHGWEIRVAGGPDGGARFEITDVEIDA